MVNGLREFVRVQGTLLGRRGGAALAARERGHKYSPFEAHSPRRGVAEARILERKGSHAAVALLLPAAHTKPGSSMGNLSAPRARRTGASATA
jgi:hypothetical protein